MKYIPAVVTAALLGMVVGCGPNSYETHPANTAGDKASSKFVTRVENCDIYEINVATVTSMLYLAKCSDVKQAEVDHNYGKNNSIHARTSTTVEGQVIPEQLVSTVEFSTDEKKVLEQADKIRHKYAILDKLSEEDKATLGFVTKQN